MPEHRLTPKPYLRQAQYYETDQMGVIHHSNYIRWFEEARVDFMSQLGSDYQTMEARGIASPVLSASAEYHSAVRFGDRVLISCTLKQLTATRMTIGYTIKDQATGQLRTSGETRHCFIRKDTGRPLALKRELHELIAAMEQLIDPDTPR